MNKILKNLFLLTGAMFLTPVCVSAKLLSVEVNSKFLSTESVKSIQLKLVKDTFLFDDKFFPTSTIINCDILEIESPKRLKRSASFVCKPTTYGRYGEEIKHFDDNLKLKFIKILDKKAAIKSIATSVASTAVNHVVPGLGLGVRAVTEAIQAEDGTRAKAAIHGAYESTPLSYIEKGKELDLDIGDLILVNIKKIK